MRFVLTDLTVMTPNLFCVAGWCPDEQRMVRPLPAGRHWPRSLVEELALRPGDILTFRSEGPSHRDYPHRSEDLIVSHVEKISGRLENWDAADAPSPSETILAAFGLQLQWTPGVLKIRSSPYVECGAHCPSLAGLAVLNSDLRLREAYGKLRALIRTPDGIFDMSVTAAALRSAWEAGGLRHVHRILPRRPRLHLRLGLAHPFGPHRRCYMMLNGVL